MPYIELANTHNTKTRILLFAEGTILKPENWSSLYNHKKYVPVGNAVSIIEGWCKQGADIVYCTSRRGRQAEEIGELLTFYRFSGSRLYFRGKRQTYKDIIKSVRPDILIEDDCRSIGGSWQMCITHVAPHIRDSINSIVVKEFSGIDHLPCSVQGLLNADFQA